MKYICSKAFGLMLVLVIMTIGGCGESTPGADEYDQGASVTLRVEDEAAGNEAGLKWLEIVDDGDYARSWVAASVMFQTAVPEDEWVRTLVAFRTPLGSVLNRQAISIKAHDTLPGTPDGRYVDMHFESEFEHKKVARENLTLVLEEDGQWRVAGYFIR